MTESTNNGWWLVSRPASTGEESPPWGRLRGRPFVKMHGLRNHFVIIDGRREPCRPDHDEIVWICDPATGVGGDQLIVIEPPVADGADAFMRIFNVDGREAEACGNATRCVAWLLLEESGEDNVVIQTLAGLLDCRRAGSLQVSCNMGRVTMDWRDIPLAAARDTLNLELEAGPLRGGIALAIGNPHVVFFVDDLGAVDITALAPGIQHNPLFPQQVNVGVAQLTPEGMQLVVYERGAGLTEACGSGACVAAYAARAAGLTDARHQVVEMPAGKVWINLEDDGSAVMTGPVEYCFEGRLPG